MSDLSFFLDKPPLVINNLTLDISDKFVCKNLNFILKPKSCLGILGANGVGKTTLLHTIAGLKTPTKISGRIELFGQNINKISPKIRAKLLGVLLQNPHLPVDMNVLEVAISSRYAHQDFFKHYSSADQKIVKNCLKECGLSEHLSQPVGSFSGGEQQRLAIALLLAQQTKLTLLDEPFNNLDLKHHHFIMDKFGKKSHQTSIIILHDLYVAKQMCSHLLLLKNGEWRMGKMADIYTLANMEWLFDTKIQTAKTDNGDFYLPLLS